MPSRLKDGGRIYIMLGKRDQEKLQKSDEQGEDLVLVLS